MWWTKNLLRMGQNDDWSCTQYVGRRTYLSFNRGHVLVSCWYGHRDEVLSISSYRIYKTRHAMVTKDPHTGWHKKTGTFETPNKNWRIPRKKIIDRNWTIKTCLLRDSNPNYQCLKITSCRGHPPPHMHSFTPTTHFKSSRSFVSLCVCCMLCRMRQSRILQSMQHTQSDTKERELLKCVVAVKECIRGGRRHLQDVIFKHW